MFGNDHKDKQDDVQPMGTQPVNHGLLGIDDDDTPPSTGVTDDAQSAPPVANPASEPTSAPALDSPVSAPGPVVEPHTGPAPVTTVPTDEPTTTTEVDDDTPLAASATDTPVVSASPVTEDNELMGIKKQALEELSPLIDHLDQDSEEKFKTTMMMIQASDNQALIPQAFTAAKEISDDKKRAQALLDIVNEINYFTHKEES